MQNNELSIIAFVETIYWQFGPPASATSKYYIFFSFFFFLQPLFLKVMQIQTWSL